MMSEAVDRIFDVDGTRDDFRKISVESKLIFARGCRAYLISFARVFNKSIMMDGSS